MKKALSPPVASLVIVACIFWFAVFLPWAVVNAFLLAPLPINVRYSRLWEETVVGMFMVGVPFGAHVGMLLTQRTLRLDCGELRWLFTALSGVYAVFVTLTSSNNEGIGYGLPPFLRGCYFLAVQSLPFWWLAYNLNARTMEIMLANRRRHCKVVKGSK